MSRLWIFCAALALATLLSPALGHAQSAETTETSTSISESQRQELERQLAEEKTSRVLAGVGALGGVGVTALGVWGVKVFAPMAWGDSSSSGMGAVFAAFFTAGSAIVAAAGVVVAIGGILWIAKSSSRINDLKEQLEQPTVSLTGGTTRRGGWTVGLRVRF